MRFACWLTMATDTSAEYVGLILLALHGKNGYAKASPCFSTRTLLLLFIVEWTSPSRLLHLSECNMANGTDTQDQSCLLISWNIFDWLYLNTWRQFNWTPNLVLNYTIKIRRNLITVCRAEAPSNIIFHSWPSNTKWFAGLVHSPLHILDMFWGISQGGTALVTFRYF
jgi:hypothetical protein